SFLPTPTPPTYTLFPYTTLFRSHQSITQLPNYQIPQLPNSPVFVFCTIQCRGVGLGVHVEHVLAAPAGGVRRVLVRPHPPLGVVDRKSTRLNSSHVSISYAVFCL